MEQGAAADDCALVNKSDAALADDLFEVLDRLEVSVEHGLVDKLPKMLRRLQLGTVRRVKHELNAITKALGGLKKQIS
jgi:hypothetical protein